MSDMMAHLHSLADGVRHMSHGDPDCGDCVQASDVVQWAIHEIDSLRKAIRRLAEQDATLSVCDGAVTVTMDASLTDAEREAMETAIYLCGATAGLADEQGNATAWAATAATLRGLLERLGGGK